MLLLLNHMCAILLCYLRLISTNYRVRIFIEKFITFFNMCILAGIYGCVRKCAGKLVIITEYTKKNNFFSTIFYVYAPYTQMGETISIGYLRNPQYNNIWAFFFLSEMSVYYTYPQDDVYEENIYKAEIVFSIYFLDFCMVFEKETFWEKYI